MSTRSSIVWGEAVHFYRDLADNEEGFYLELRGKDIDFSAAPGSVTVRIPPHIWEVIRTSATASLDLVDKTDKDLRARVTKDVDERIAGYVKAKTKKNQAWASFIGSALYGGADLPRKEQIRLGMKYFRGERSKQRAVVDKMKTLKSHGAGRGE